MIVNINLSEAELSEINNDCSKHCHENVKAFFEKKFNTGIEITEWNKGSLSAPIADRRHHITFIVNG